MSFQSDCPACQEGHHERHDASHGVRDGLIGGTSCGCQGDCADRSLTTKLLTSIFGEPDA